MYGVTRQCARRAAVQAAVLTTVMTLTACRSATPPAVDTAPEPSSSPSPAELEAIYWARIDSARTRFTHEDVRFVTGMIQHHAQALVMASLAASNDARQQIRVLAARIINAQEDEIALMQQWLRDRGQPVPELHRAGTDIMVHGADHSALMPGMLSSAQLEELDRARGAEFDRLFLFYMIQHHRGAVTMVRELVRTDGAAQDPALFKLASDIQADQTAEIARMERLLVELSAGGGSR